MMGNPAGQDKEEISEPVQINLWPWTHVFLTREFYNLALRSPAYGAALVQKAAQLSSPRKDKGLQRLQVFLKAIHKRLHLFDLRFADSDRRRTIRFARSGQLRSQIKKLLLHLAQNLLQLGADGRLFPQFSIERPDDPNARIQLVNRSESLDPRRILWNPAATDKPRFPFVSGPGIDAINPYRHRTNLHVSSLVSICRLRNLHSPAVKPHEVSTRVS